MPPPPLPENLRELLTELRSAIVGLTFGELPKSSPVVVATVRMFARCVPLFDGVVYLLTYGLVEESLILGRSLFEETMRLAQLAEESSDVRSGLIVGHLGKSHNEKIGLMHHSVRLGLEHEPEPIERKLAADKEVLREFSTRHGVRKQRFRVIAEAATRYGRSEDYWTYELANEMVHGSDIALFFRSSTIQPDTVQFTTRTRDKRLIAGAAAFAARSLIQSTRAIATILGLSSPRALDDIALRLETLERDLSSESSPVENSA